MKRIYLICPYSHSLHDVRKARTIIASNYASKLMSEGDLVFSPISHGYMIETCGTVAGDFETWAKFNDSILETWATHVYVLMLDGWRESKGVAYEVQLAKKLGLTVEYVEGEE